MTTSSLAALLAPALRAAVQAGDPILEVYSAEMQVEYKEDRSPLTLADTRSHAVIAAGLADTGIPVLSEEGKSIPYAERGRWRRLWVVDPLDGTKEFVKRLGEFTVNIALVEDGRPRLGAVFVPVTNRLYFGASARAPSVWTTRRPSRRCAPPAPPGTRPRSWRGSKRARQAAAGHGRPHPLRHRRQPLARDARAARLRRGEAPGARGGRRSSRPAARSSTAWWPRARRTSTPGWGRPWSGTPRPGRRSSRPPARASSAGTPASR